MKSGRHDVKGYQKPFRCSECTTKVVAVKDKLIQQ